MHHDTAEMTESDAKMATDPVCGMKVDIGARGPSAKHAGHNYYFCSEGCRGKFAAEPERYLTKQDEPKPLPKGTLYTCPMHPEIVKEGPGHCPICGRWFNPKDSYSYCTSNRLFARFFERFGQVSLWGGMVAPIIPLIIGLNAVITEHTLLPGGGRYGGRPMRLDGWPAVSMGIAWLGLAFVLHMNFFWGRVKTIWPLAGFGVVVGVIAIIVGWGTALIG
jgi:YHS domain-containing protein